MRNQYLEIIIFRKMHALLLVFLVLFVCLVHAAPAPLWYLGDSEEPVFSSFAAAKDAYTPAITQYNNNPDFICNPGDWRWELDHSDWFRNATYWYAYKNAGTRCNHTEVGGQFPIKARCPSNYATSNGGASCACPRTLPFESNGTCMACPPGRVRANNKCEPVNLEPPKNPPCCENTTGNPVQLPLGRKIAIETDYDFDGIFRLARMYKSPVLNSHMTDTAQFDSNYIDPSWTTNWHNRRIVYSPGNHFIGSYLDFAYVMQGFGKAVPFQRTGSDMTTGWASDPDQNMRVSLTWTLDGGGNPIVWVYKEATGYTETFNSGGWLSTITYPDGRVITLEYAGVRQLARVRDSLGRVIEFTYTPDRHLLTALTPNGLITYGYEQPATDTPDPHDNLLKTVTYADGKTRQYFYEQTLSALPLGWPHNALLTGIQDENNVRFATYVYDTKGRVTSSNHSGTDNYIYTYDNADAQKATVQTPSGISATLQWANKYGALKKTGQSQPLNLPGKTDMSSASFNPTTALLEQTVDSRGFITKINSYDVYGNITSRTEAFGTADARTITTEWNNVVNQPSRITESGRITELVYDNRAHITLKKVTDTTLTPNVVRQTTYSYVYNADVNNPVIRKMTVNGPRSDVSDIVVYDYSAQGNLALVTQQIGGGSSLVTRYENYDAGGRVGKITAPNGVVTTLTYTERGWLKTRTVSSASITPLTTTFSYDGVGQLTKVTMPDASFVEYIYDAAHRLTDIKDGVGNRIHYTLNGAGLRTDETVNDTNGSLAGLLKQVEMARNASRTPAAAEEL